MSGTYKPISALSPDNQGAANTIVSIVFIATSVLFSTVRFAVGRKKLLQFDVDDATFGIALCFGITFSIVSNLSVGAGLGQHQNTLSVEKVERYHQLHYTSQLLAIIALACAKLSIVLLFRRIFPATLVPLTLKIFIPIIAFYTSICMLLVGFQCQLPSPWILDPKTCSTHGRVHYATISLNIATDLLLAVWILPAIWALQMKDNIKFLVMALFGSRIVVCAVDIGRIVLLWRALHSEDQTWAQLPWVILDQVVVHLSINHTTLPRIHVFFSNLQTGLLVTQVTARGENSRSKGSKQTDEQERSSGWKWSNKSRGSLSKSKMIKMLRIDRSERRKEGSISESPLRLQPEQGIELSTTIYAERCSTSSASGKNEDREMWNQESTSSGLPSTTLPKSLSRFNGGGQLKTTGSKTDIPDITINVQRTVEMTTEVLDDAGKTLS
ncbi:hypothetical protein DM02DRAFT_655868 [Periconia macrospinosa]|uniref:Rhodopsin domain-containing protein n=1 Tax=Periconia macrospinosa TaxID=97972 RepID=A0A2V1DPT6_9PLEO|nr:hypothetical protein DM02DRAFT_655868 [Periconia macrospinosa]